MKYSQMTPDEKVKVHNHVTERWNGILPILMGSMKRVLAYLFTLNTGGAALSVTYIATKHRNDQVENALWIFVTGICAVLLHATWDYYSDAYLARSLRKDIQKLYADQMDWEDWWTRDQERAPLEWIGHALGWISALCFLAGTFIGGYALT